MNTRLLEHIIVISEEKSLSKAADRLLVSQPALSQQLKRLETELDAKLFFGDGKKSSAFDRRRKNLCQRGPFRLKHLRPGHGRD